MPTVLSHKKKKKTLLSFHTVTNRWKWIKKIESDSNIYLIWIRDKL